MEYRLIKSAKGIWVFVDNRHKKTLPKEFEKDFDKLKDKLSFDRKRLTATERIMFQNIKFYSFADVAIEQIKKTEPHLYSMLSKSKPVATRFVNSKNGNRYEMKFDNGLFVKIPRNIHTASPNKLDDAYLNY